MAEIYTPDQKELAAYYQDRRQLRRNIASLVICNLGWGVVLTLVLPLMTLHMSAQGVSSYQLGLIGSANAVLVSILVMYFSWKSDHTVSRLGRRTPYLLVSAPFVIAPIILFPLFPHPVSLVLLYCVHILFMDLKGSTYALLPIDCVPRASLARFGSIFGILGGLVAFASLHWGFLLKDLGEAAPYFIGGGVMACTTLAALLLREPPIANPTAESWRPWTTLRVGWKDRPTVLLMISVALLNGFNVMFGTWIWLYARNDLGLEAGEIARLLSWNPLIGLAMAWPAAWVVDRFAGIRPVLVMWCGQIAACVILLARPGPDGLLAAAIIHAVVWPFYAGADILVVRSVHPRDVGSVTASNSFTRNLASGAMIFASGWLIDRLAGHQAAFLVGVAVNTVGLVLFLFYLAMRRGGRAPPPVSAANPALAAS